MTPWVENWHWKRQNSFEDFENVDENVCVGYTKTTFSYFTICRGGQLCNDGPTTTAIREWILNKNIVSANQVSSGQLVTKK